MLNTLVANLPYLLKGAVVTLWLSLIVVTFGTLLGVIVGLCANVGGRLVQALVTTYVFVLRGIPVLVVMLLGYYVFPALGFRANAYVAVGVAQIIYIGAFVAEINPDETPHSGIVDVSLKGRAKEIVPLLL